MAFQLVRLQGSFNAGTATLDIICSLLDGGGPIIQTATVWQLRGRLCSSVSPPIQSLVPSLPSLVSRMGLVWALVTHIFKGELGTV